jgi:hypothetical protein
VKSPEQSNIFDFSRRFPSTNDVQQLEINPCVALILLAYDVSLLLPPDVAPLNQ